MSESPLGSFFPLLKDQRYWQLTSSVIQILEVIQSSFIGTVSIHFSSNWQCFCIYNTIGSLSSDNPTTLLVFSSQYAFIFFCNMDRLRNFQIFKFGCFLLNNSFSIHFSPFIFYCEKTGQTKLLLQCFDRNILS